MKKEDQKSITNKKENKEKERGKKSKIKRRNNFNIKAHKQSKSKP